MDKNIIKVDKVKKYFSEILVLNDVSLKIQRSNVVVICGPSGCGKSTLLRCINGLEGLNSGDIIINDKSILDKNKLRAIRLELGMVFQQFNLFPHKTVLENIILSPIINLGINKENIESHESLGLIGMRERIYPWGGQVKFKGLPGEGTKIIITIPISLK